MRQGSEHGFATLPGADRQGVDKPRVLRRFVARYVPTAPHEDNSRLIVAILHILLALSWQAPRRQSSRRLDQGLRAPFVGSTLRRLSGPFAGCDSSASLDSETTN